MKLSEVPARKAPMSMGQLPLYRQLDLGAALQQVLPILGQYRAFKVEAVGLWWPAKNVAYGAERYLEVPGSRTSMYVQYQLKPEARGVEKPLLVRRTGARYWDWSINGGRYLTIEVDPVGDAQSCRGLLWLLQRLGHNVSRTSDIDRLRDYGYQTVESLAPYLNLGLEYCLSHVAPKWWPFCRSIWQHLPGALMPVSCTPLVAAYRGTIMADFKATQGGPDFNKYFGDQGQLNQLIKVGARFITRAQEPWKFNPLDFGAWNANPAMAMFGGTDESTFWERRKQLMTRGYT